MKITILIYIIILLPACSSPVTHQTPITSYQSNSRNHNSQDKEDFIGFPQPDKYSICYEHSCKKHAIISLSDQQWKNIKSLFSPVASTAEEERSQISQAIALLEKFTGEQAGTSADLGENLPGLGMAGQMDCIDESTNTTVYLRMLQNDGLLRWHQESPRVSRGFFTGLMSMPHSTAVIQETNNSEKYAVDSWYLNNGEEPFIVPLAHWKAGWKPE